MTLNGSVHIKINDLLYPHKILYTANLVSTITKEQKQEMFGAKLIKKSHPIQNHSSDLCNESGVGLSYEKVLLFNIENTKHARGNELGSELFVERQNIREFIRRIFEISEEINLVLDGIEIRPVLQDDFGMSPAYKKDVFGVHFIWKNQYEPVIKAVTRIENQVLSLVVGVHWGKLFTFKSEQLEAIYGERIKHFLRIVRKWDPEMKFTNEYFQKNFESIGL